MGALKQGSVFTIAALLGALGAVASCGPPDRQSSAALVGHWLGNASYRDATVKFEFDVEARGDSLAATFTSDELLVRDLPIGDFSYAKPRIHFVVPGMDEPLTFDGWLRRNLIVGVLSSPHFRNPERKATLPQLSLRHTHPSSFPYRVDTLRFAGAAGSFAVRVFTPSTQGPYPAVLMVPGGASPIAAQAHAHADRLARAGFVAMVYDQRGAGDSGGSVASASADAPARDAAALFQRLRALPGVDSTHVGLWGLDGAGVVAEVASGVRPAFTVVISPPPTARAGLAAARAPLLVCFGERALGAGDAKDWELQLHAANHPDAQVRVIGKADRMLRIHPEGDEAFDWPREVPGALDGMIAWLRERAVAR